MTIILEQRVAVILLAKIVNKSVWILKYKFYYSDGLYSLSVRLICSLFSDVIADYIMSNEYLYMNHEP
jgi:hypothetical protein